MSTVFEKQLGKVAQTRRIVTSLLMNDLPVIGYPGVRVWNNLSNEIRQMPKVKFKRNIHNMLLQKLSEANEYIDLLDLNMS